MGYLKFWKLKEKPFEELCNTRFFFESDDHREALDRMLYVVNDRNMNMGLLTGEVGCGKTITKSVFESSLPKQHFEVIGFENSNFTFLDILYDIVTRTTFREARLDLSSEEAQATRDDKYLLMALFKKKLEKLAYEEKRHLVLIFDEAQQMANEVLDEVKNLTNITSQTQNYLTIFFVGQPEMREKIRALRQVDQRIFLRFHLNTLDYNNTTKYVLHRLRIAGPENLGIFAAPALEMIFRATGGVPREINRLCKLALNYGFAQELPEIRGEDIGLILDDMRKHG
ncbi:MAG TPA: AAA family ATPase [Chitinivibrionales bacterium]|nr:AAA family ATPase [Chitinivibrionales bacterium]